jgi:hypothetical protein
MNFPVGADMDLAAEEVTGGEGEEIGVDKGSRALSKPIR